MVGVAFRASRQPVANPGGWIGSGVGDLAVGHPRPSQQWGHRDTEAGCWPQRARTTRRAHWRSRFTRDELL